jgi:hypothetical protein
MALNFDHKAQTARHVYGVADAHTSAAHSSTAATHIICSWESMCPDVSRRYLDGRC